MAISSASPSTRVPHSRNLPVPVTHGRSNWLLTPTPTSSSAATYSHYSYKEQVEA